MLGDDAQTACVTEKGVGLTRNRSTASEFVVWKPGQRIVRRYATGSIGVEHCDRSRGVIALRSGITGEGRSRRRGRLVFADLQRKCTVTSLENAYSVRAMADGSYIVGTEREIWKVTPRAEPSPSN